MKRTTGAMVLLAALSGCVSQEPGAGSQYMSRAFDHGSVGCMSGTAATGPSVPGFQGPYGQPVARNGHHHGYIFFVFDGH